MKIPSQLKSSRLIIRPFKTTDLGSFLEFMLDERVTKYLNFTPEQKTEQGAKELLEMTINSYVTPNPLFALAITDKVTELYLGSCGIAPLPEHNTYECFYALLPKYRRQGFAKEAMEVLCAYAFHELNIFKIIADISIKNQASQQIAKSLGMKLERVYKKTENSELRYIFSLTNHQFN